MKQKSDSSNSRKNRDLDPLVQDIVDARKAQKLTQAELATFAGLSRRTVILVESGGDCTLSTLRRITTALGLQMHAHTPQRPTLDDVTRENEKLFAHMRAAGTNPRGYP